MKLLSKKEEFSGGRCWGSYVAVLLFTKVWLKGMAVKSHGEKTKQSQRTRKCVYTNSEHSRSNCVLNAGMVAMGKTEDTQGSCTHRPLVLREDTQALERSTEPS